MARVTLDRPGISQLLHSPTGPVPRHFAKIGRDTATLARATAPRSTGQLASSITSSTRITATSIRTRAGVERNIPAARRPWEAGLRPASRSPRPSVAGVLVMQNRGRAFITPRSKNFLRFGVTASGPVVYVLFTRGYSANRFLIEAFRARSPYPVTVGPFF